MINQMLISQPSNHTSHLLGDLHAGRSSHHPLDVAIDRELSSGKSTNHEETSADTSVAAADTEFLADLGQTGDGSITRSALGLVDLAEHGVGGLRDESGGETSDQTRAEVDTSLGTIGKRILVERAVDHLRDLLEDDELGHGVGDPTGVSPNEDWSNVRNLLLEENGTETRVESAETLVLRDLAETAQETTGESGLRDETDTSSFQGAKGDISEEFGGSGRGEVDGSAVGGGSLKTEVVDALLLEELVTTELEGTLEKVTGGGRAETSEESASTLVLDNLAEATQHTTVVGGRVQLDPGLDAERKILTMIKTSPHAPTGCAPWVVVKARPQKNLHINGR